MLEHAEKETDMRLNLGFANSKFPNVLTSKEKIEL